MAPGKYPQAWGHHGAVGGGLGGGGGVAGCWGEEKGGGAGSWELRGAPDPLLLFAAKPRFLIRKMGPTREAAAPGGGGETWRETSADQPATGGGGRAGRPRYWMVRSELGWGWQKAAIPHLPVHPPTPTRTQGPQAAKGGPVGSQQSREIPLGRGRHMPTGQHLGPGGPEGEGRRRGTSSREPACSHPGESGHSPAQDSASESPGGTGGDL